MTDVASISRSKAVVGCLIDVSGSMKEALDSRASAQPSPDRLKAAIRAALRIAEDENIHGSDAMMFVGAFGLNEKKRCPPVVDLCSVIEALLELRDDDARSGHERLIDIASTAERAYIKKYIESKLTDDQARIIHKHLEHDQTRMQEFLDAIPTDRENRRTRTIVTAPARLLDSATLTLQLPFQNAANSFSQLANRQSVQRIEPASSSVARDDDRSDHKTTLISSAANHALFSVSAEGRGVVTKAATWVADRIEDRRVDNSRAIELAHNICDEWWRGVEQFRARRIFEVISLLKKLEDYTDDWGTGVRTEEDKQEEDKQDTSANGLQEYPTNHVLSMLRHYIYGSTPLNQALHKAKAVFDQYGEDSSVLSEVCEASLDDDGSDDTASCGGETSEEECDRETTAYNLLGNRSLRVLVIVSDGCWNGHEPFKIAQSMKEPSSESRKIVIVALHLTSDATPQQHKFRLYDQEQSSWGDGQRTLYRIASRISCITHPVPLLQTLGWDVPKSGETALYMAIHSSAMLDDMSLLLAPSHFGYADTILDTISHAKLDRIINDKHVRRQRKPSNQKAQSTCYAHATATIFHLAMSRVIGIENQTPSIRKIRQDIKKLFPPHDRGYDTEKVLKCLTESRLYYPIYSFKEVDENGARAALLGRRPVLTRFALSENGWKAFSQHFSYDKGGAAAKRTLLCRDMLQYVTENSDGGHAVVLIGCTAHSLTFLNSWGKSWGNNGLFSVENSMVLRSRDRKMQFYDVGWRLKDLHARELNAWEDYRMQQLRMLASDYPGIIGFDLLCPRCGEKSKMTEPAEAGRQTICPSCGEGFILRPKNLCVGVTGNTTRKNVRYQVIDFDIPEPTHEEPAA